MCRGKDDTSQRLLLPWLKENLWEEGGAGEVGGGAVCGPIGIFSSRLQSLGGGGSQPVTRSQECSPTNKQVGAETAGLLRLLRAAATSVLKSSHRQLSDSPQLPRPYQGGRGTATADVLVVVGESLITGRQIKFVLIGGDHHGSHGRINRVDEEKDQNQNQDQDRDKHQNQD